VQHAYATPRKSDVASGALSLIIRFCAAAGEKGIPCV
jgi:hypothetical protein